MDIERFITDCTTARLDNDPQAAIREVLARAVSTPDSVLATLGEPTMAGLSVLHRSPTLTIFNATWTPNMTLMPHDHGMWALIGLYTGREDNILWRHTPDRIEAHDVRTLFAGDVATLATDAIHSVTNPLSRFAGGIHIYGGDFFATPRHQWHPETLETQPSDGETIRAIFESENARLRY